MKFIYCYRDKLNAATYNKREQSARAACLCSAKFAE